MLVKQFQNFFDIAVATRGARVSAFDESELLACACWFHMCAPCACSRKLDRWGESLWARRMG
jgi:hypothetical protein